MVNLSGIVSRIFPSSRNWVSGSKAEGRAKSRAEYLKEKEEREQEAKDLKVVKEYYAEWLTAQCGLKISADKLCAELVSLLLVGIDWIVQVLTWDAGERSHIVHAC